jgi:F-type H+-transporting ATPase subunit delta
MTTSAIVAKAEAAVYAQVLLDAASSSNTVFEVAGQLNDLLKAVRGSIDLRNALIDDTTPVEVRRNIAQEVFVGYDPALLAVFDVMIDREDIDVLSRTAAVYSKLAEEALGAVIIDVTTVVALDDSLRAKIIDKYSTQLGTGILLREHIDPALVGGIVLSAHGKRIDASVVSQLESARVTLTKQ